MSDYRVRFRSRVERFDGTESGAIRSLAAMGASDGDMVGIIWGNAWAAYTLVRPAFPRTYRQLTDGLYLHRVHGSLEQAAHIRSMCPNRI
jgi:hypothetical protein